MKKKKNINENVLTRPQVDSVIALYSDGKYEKAIDSIKELNDQYPNQPILFNIIGACYKSLGQLEAALKMFEVAVTINPNYAEAFYNLGVVAREQDNFNLAIKSYQSAISIQPNYPDAHNNLGNTFKEQKRLNDAIESYEWAIAYKHDFFQAFNNLGLCYSDLGNSELAVKNFTKATEIEPNFIDAHFNLAILMKEIGRREESMNSFESVLKIDSKHAKAHRNLSAMKKYVSEDPQILLMESLLEKGNLKQSEYIELNFALAKAYEDLGDFKKLFKFLNRGNELKKKSLNYSIDKDEERFRVLEKLFASPPSILKKNIIKTDELKPIFILGMPRSGTSLVEQIISSHHKVYGAGELRFLRECAIPCITELVNKNSNKVSKKDLLSIRSYYLDSLAKLNPSERYITDKMPANFSYVGLILSAFPEAKIVHCKRNAMATCWSNYKFLFVTKGNGFAFNQEDLASYYKLYEGLMEFWHKLFPNKIYDISYEELTKNQEKETRDLLKYCDLDWDENCLQFHKNNRLVKTVSTLQVRREMYQGSSEVWKKYESYLKPMIEGLNSK